MTLVGQTQTQRETLIAPLHAVGLGVTADVQYTMNIIADTVLGCGRFCGYRGSCALPAANETQASCECDCGWAGAACNQPSGFCETPVSNVLPGNTSSITSDFESQCRGASFLATLVLLSDASSSSQASVSAQICWCGPLL